MKRIFFTTLILLSMFAEPNAFQCNQCHSKNPKMINMHKALGYKDCFKCHGINAKIDKKNIKTQMLIDDRCVGCHKN